ncbi:unnamed protein product, partial [Durusdinium trenchii]
MKKVDMEALELGDEFLQSSNLHDLKAEASRWHNVSNAVIDSLLEIESLVRDLEKRAKDEGLGPNDIKVGPGHALSDKSLSELHTFIK